MPQGLPKSFQLADSKPAYHASGTLIQAGLGPPPSFLPPVQLWCFSLWPCRACLSFPGEPRVTLHFSFHGIDVSTASL